ncbi:MAG: tRNA uracil 4-sulfurtransferase ThiI [bacterium]|nr:tRNA uracil 4-sulfurtransferase ThiI [bacterium]
MKKIILIKYGELTTKKDNRMFFINTLYKNIINKLKDIDVIITKNRVRMFIETDNKNIDEAVKRLKKIFGIHSIVICEKVNTNKEDIIDKINNIVLQKEFKTFKVETKRSDKNFPIKSMDFNKLVATSIFNIKDNIKVDVHQPDYLIKIEIRDKYTYIYNEEIKGLGGYPVGVQGKAMLMISGGIDSPVAGYLALKRGISLEALYFEALPHTSLEARNKVKTLVNKLQVYSSDIKLNIINFTKIQEEIYQKCDHSYMITIMRRMMYRITEKLAKKHKCKMIVNGESIGQVASQTIQSIYVINSVTNYPIIRPVACLDKIQIIDIAKEIDTYTTSIIPYEDCCTVFVPKHPVINPSLDYAIKEESKIKYVELIDNAINDIITININDDKYQDLI